jgi:DUF4097 and DUF4098 domain-containing protein YvlB
MKLPNHPLAGLPVAALLATLSALPAMAGATDSVDRRVPAEANGEVVISNVSGTVTVRGWDRNEVHVTGQLDEGVQRLDVEAAGSGRIIVKVVLPRGSTNDGEANIDVQVPKNSTVEVSAVSADVSSRGVLGTQRLNSVSGEVSADIAGDNSSVRSVSGDITVRGGGKPLVLRVSSVSGNIDASNISGKLDLVTVSGDARAQMGEASDIRGRTTSGDLDLRARLAPNGRIDVEAVSGDMELRIANSGVALEIESFSGDIFGCLAKGVERVSKYGPGKRLDTRTGDASARVRAKTLSGDVDICDR